MIMILAYSAIVENKENGKTYSAIKFLIEQKLKHNYNILIIILEFNTIINNITYFLADWY